MASQSSLYLYLTVVFSNKHVIVQTLQGSLDLVLPLLGSSMAILDTLAVQVFTTQPGLAPQTELTLSNREIQE